MYKKGLTKSKFKQTMRMFWTERWKYERTPEEWVTALNSNSGIVWSTLVKDIGSMPWGKRVSDLLYSAIDKLILEKKLKKEEGVNLKKMLDGTPEDAYIAVSAMAVLKPKKFKKIIPKNTETNE